MLIRQEKPQDIKEIYDLVKAAFAAAEHRDGNEQDLVAALRKSSAYIPELVLTAEIDGSLAGHILFTKAAVGDREVLALAPLSVKPEYQRQGVGAALIAEGHRVAMELGYEYSLVLGSELYYPRFGYIPAAEVGALPAEGVPAENFMAFRLREDAEPLDGSIVYAKEFGI